MGSQRAKTAVSFFGPDGALARVLPEYESRPEQERLAEAVARVIEHGGLLLAEAGTGTGKTIAYLAATARIETRVVISTGTKNLQEQLVQKDLPLLARALGRRVAVAVMKGRSNYLCKLRYESFVRQGTFARREELPLFRAVSTWADHTQTGDRAEVRELPDTAEFWRDISATGEQCLGQGCAQFDDCFVTQMRRRALEAQVVVVNHHLLCADLALDERAQGRVVPEYDTLILDEAHMLEDAATQYFGLAVSTHRLDELVRDLERELSAARIEAREARTEGAAARERGDHFFGLVAREVGKRLTRHWRSAEVGEQAEALVLRLEGMAAALMTLAERPDALTSVARRARELSTELRFLVAAEDEGHVFFAERRGRGVFLRAAPIDVAPLLRERLFGSLRAAVLTSATLAVDGRFDYVAARLGLDGAETLLLDSPFDFTRQAVLYVPRGMPQPSSADFVERAAEQIAGLLEISRGRAFVLFTSYANMHAVAERLAGDLPYPIFMQGEAPKPALIDLFRSTPSAVLLATASFWQGVDVVGEQLSCVIIDKLPFASPSDPIVAARIEHLNRTDHNAFAEYQVPEAVLTLKQGLGRLIRATTDKGILAVLDSRLVERSYGRRFLASLPAARVVHGLPAVAEFFDGPA